MGNSIIDAWNTVGIDKPYSSSYKSHFVKNRLINWYECNRIKSIITRNCTLLDVGAGLGRFSIAISKKCEKVYALEPAPKIYKRLVEYAACNENIVCINKSFEDFDHKNYYDYILFSGVLCFMDDHETKEILDKAKSISGRIIIRDFICNNNKKFPTIKLPDAHFYCRTEIYWNKLGFNCINLSHPMQYKEPWTVFIFKV
jgi:SAM-dependent methyltransferase